MSTHVLRWGILGTAHVARKNWQAIYHTRNSTVVAVASRDIGRGRRFVAECQAARPMPSVPQVYGSYEELLADRNVDAVYVPLPTALRKPWVIGAARAGKHVICEKPCASTVADLEEMIEACRRHSVQFMDGVMFVHSSRMPAMRKILDDGVSVGPLRRITLAFTFCAPPAFVSTNIRADSALEPHGCLGDLGWYCIRFILWAMNGEMPRSVSGRLIAGRGRPGAARAPTDFSAELLFDNDVSAEFSCSFSTGFQEWAVVAGTLGQLKVPDFVVPASGQELEFEVASGTAYEEGFDFKVKTGSRRFAVAEHGSSHPTAQETVMLRNFADQVHSGALNPSWPSISLKTQRILNACYDSAAP